MDLNFLIPFISIEENPIFENTIPNRSPSYGLQNTEIIRDKIENIAENISSKTV